LCCGLAELTVTTICFPGAIFVFISSAPPSKRGLGSVNGVTQTMGAVARAVGPAVSTSLFAFSSGTNALGGNLVYLVMCVGTALAMLAGLRFPQEPWEQEDDKQT
jgi:hypothetical protein